MVIKHNQLKLWRPRAYPRALNMSRYVCLSIPAARIAG